jgi:hypothetical protein
MSLSILIAFAISLSACVSVTPPGSVGGGFLFADGLKASYQDCKAAQEKREAERNSCKDQKVGDLNLGLVVGASKVADGSSAFANQLASAYWQPALIGAGAAKLDPTGGVCWLGGAALGARFGDGTVSRWVDSALGKLLK